MTFADPGVVTVPTFVRVPAVATTAVPRICTMFAEATPLTVAVTVFMTVVTVPVSTRPTVPIFVNVPDVPTAAVPRICTTLALASPVNAPMVPPRTVSTDPTFIRPAVETTFVPLTWVTFTTNVFSAVVIVPDARKVTVPTWVIVPVATKFTVPMVAVLWFATKFTRGVPAAPVAIVPTQ